MDTKPFKHGEEGTHAVCIKHAAEPCITCCECWDKTDCEYGQPVGQIDAMANVKKLPDWPKRSYKAKDSLKRGMKHAEQEKEGWEENFENLYKRTFEVFGEGWEIYKPQEAVDKLKDFIRQELVLVRSQAKKEVVREIEEKVKLLWVGFDIDAERLKERVLSILSTFKEEK